MSGIFLSGGADTLISNCSIDGTDARHSALWFAECSAMIVDACFIFMAQQDTGRESATATVNTIDSTLTLSDDSWVYDGMPFVMTTTGTYPTFDYLGVPAFGVETYLAKKVGSSKIELYKSNLIAANKVTISAAGTGTLTVTSGNNYTTSLSRCTRINITNSRIAGAPAGAVNVVRSISVQYLNILQYALNGNDTTDVSAVKIIGSTQNIFANSQLGSLFSESGGSNRIREAVLIEDINEPGGTAVSLANIFNSNLYNNTQGEYIVDNSAAAYNVRNLITGYDNLFGQFSGDPSRIDSATYRSEPSRLYYFAETSTTSIPNATKTDLTWAASGSIANPANITNGSTLTFPNTGNSLVSIVGSVGFITLPAANFYILVEVSVLIGSGAIKAFEFYLERKSNDSNTNAVVPFSVEVPVGLNAEITVSVTQNSGSPLSVSTAIEKSKLCVTKIADYTA
jgi:hypothetical protein